MPNKIVKGLKVNGRDGGTDGHNGGCGERKSNQLGDANFMEHQLRRVFYDTFLRKQNSRVVPSRLNTHCQVPPGPHIPRSIEPRL